MEKHTIFKDLYGGSESKGEYVFYAKELMLKNGKEEENIMSNEMPVYDLKALSKKLNIGIRTLREYIKRGDLKARKIGKAYYVTEVSLMAFLGPDS